MGGQLEKHRVEEMCGSDAYRRIRNYLELLPQCHNDNKKCKIRQKRFEGDWKWFLRAWRLCVFPVAAKEVFDDLWSLPQIDYVLAALALLAGSEPKTSSPLVWGSVSASSGLGDLKNVLENFVLSELTKKEQPGIELTNIAKKVRFSDYFDVFDPDEDPELFICNGVLEDRDGNAVMVFNERMNEELEQFLK